MIIFYLVFYAVSIVGLGLSLLIHVFSFFEIISLWEFDILYVVIGIFVLFLPIYFITQKNVYGKSFKKDPWEHMYSLCPKWMKYAHVGAMAYAVINMLWMFISAPERGPYDAQTAQFFSAGLIFAYCSYIIVLHYEIVYKSNI